MSLVRRGFMLLEALVALLIVGLTATAAVELYGAQMRAARREPRLVTATALGQDRLAAVRLLEPEQLAGLPDSLARGRFAAPFAEYRWTAATARSKVDDLYEVHVEISWLDGRIALSTLVYAPRQAVSR